MTDRQTDKQTDRISTCRLDPSGRRGRVKRSAMMKRLDVWCEPGFKHWLDGGQKCDTHLLGGSRVSSHDKRTLGEGGVNGDESKTPCEWIEGWNILGFS